MTEKKIFKGWELLHQIEDLNRILSMGTKSTTIAIYEHEDFYSRYAPIKVPQSLIKPILKLVEEERDKLKKELDEL